MTPPVKRSDAKVEVRGKLKDGAETENAVMLVRNGFEVWFPLSQVHSVHRTFAKLGYDYLMVTPWIARQKGIIDA